MMMSRVSSVVLLLLVASCGTAKSGTTEDISGGDVEWDGSDGVGDLAEASDPGGETEPVSCGDERFDLFFEPFADCEAGAMRFHQACSDGWCSIPAGTFHIGNNPESPWAPTYDENDKYWFSVTVTRPYVIQQTEMTVQEFVALTGQDQSVVYERCAPQPGHDCPAMPNSGWPDAIAAANAMSTGQSLAKCYGPDGDPLFTPIADCPGYRLPTEAEWERAARAGTETDAYFGDIVQIQTRECDFFDVNVEEHAWYACNARSLVHAVGLKTPNPWGLYDVMGNAWEVVHDEYAQLAEVGLDSVVDPSGPAIDYPANYRVTKGGEFRSSAHGVRHQRRATGNDSRYSYDYSFRLARTLHGVESPL